MSFTNNDRYIPYIDGCRGIAISIVVLSHAGLGNFIPGKFGVTLFFFISGFLITKLLLLEMNKKGHIGLKDFYLRRFFRLYPALLGMILVSLVASAVLACPIPAKDILSALFYFTNYYIGWLRPPVADCSRILDIIWSLSVEEHFYFFFPVITWLFLRKRQNKHSKRFLNFLFFLCLIALLARIQLYINHSNDLSFVTGRVYFSTHTRMDSILWGCMAAILLFELKSAWYTKILADRRFLALGFLLLFLSVAIRNNVFRETLLFSFQGIGLLLIVPSFGYKRSEIAMKLLENKLLIFIGKISYSLYLFHWVASKYANSRSEEHSLQWQLIFWPLSILLALSSFYFIEKPFVALRRRFGSHVQK
jgi:peptidoglycan/LPS O-acetylase OafA/YrhL